MYSATERMQKILAAGDSALARIDAILAGADNAPTKREEETRLITITEAAERLKVTRATVYNMVLRGQLAARPVCGRKRITMQSITDLINGAGTDAKGWGCNHER